MHVTSTGDQSISIGIGPEAEDATSRPGERFEAMVSDYKKMKLDNKMLKRRLDRLNDS